MPSLILFEFNFDQVDQLFLTKNVLVRNGKFNLVAKVLDEDCASQNDLKKVTKWVMKHGLQNKGQLNVEHVSSEELESLREHRNHLLTDDENGDSLAYPHVTKEQLDAELDQMKQEREQYFQMKTGFNPVQNPWGYRQPEMQAFNPTGFQFYHPYYFQPMFYPHQYAFNPQFNQPPQSNFWNLTGPNKDDENEN